MKDILTTELIKILNKTSKEFPVYAHLKGKVIAIETSYIDEDLSAEPKKVVLLVTEEEECGEALTVDQAIKILRYQSPVLPIYIENKGYIVDAGIRGIDEERMALFLFSEDD